MHDEELLDLFLDRFASALMIESDKAKLDKIILRIIGNSSTCIEIYPQFLLTIILSKKSC